MAIAKVVFNGDTLMDVTQKTVVADSMLSGTTALKNDGTDITGSIQTLSAQTITPTTSSQTIPSGKYLTGAQTIEGVVCSNLSAENIMSGVTVKVGTATDDDSVASVTGTASSTPKLQNKEINLDTNQTIVTVGENQVVQFTISRPYGERTDIGVSDTAIKLTTIDTNKKYTIYGQITFFDNNSNNIGRVNIYNQLDPSDNNNQYLNIATNNYISSIYFKWHHSGTNSEWATLYIHYRAGTYSATGTVFVVENKEEYDGLLSVTVNMDGEYGLYKCIADHQHPIWASGSSTYYYSATDVSNWCNHFSNTSTTNGNVYDYQFTGIRFSGSFYFNNIKRLPYYAFALPYLNTDVGTTYSAYLYFPELLRMDAIIFASNKDIRYIEAPKCISIGSSAFYRCRVSNISFPLCERIYQSAFALATRLEIANFPECSIIESNAFNQCSSLTTASFSKCTTIGSYAFASCSKLNSISFPLCSDIKNSAFYSCASLITINFPSCLTIGNYAFASCVSLTTADFPLCSSIGMYAFQQCSSLTTISFPQCSSIGNQAFNNCVNLQNVTLGSNYSIIASGTFRSCLSLSQFDFTYITSIGNYAFESCSFTFLSFSNISTAPFFSNSAFANNSNLSYVFLNNTLPTNSQVDIFNLFVGCSRLLSLYLLGTASYYNGYNSSFISGTPISNMTSYTDGEYGKIYVPASYYNTYISARGWSQYASRIVSLTDAEIEALLE